MTSTHNNSKSQTASRNNFLLLLCIISPFIIFPLLRTSQSQTKSSPIIDLAEPKIVNHYHSDGNMAWFQKQFTLQPKSRGSYLITDQVISALPEIKNYKVGLLNLFIQHTSCALSLNENWDEDVREDMSDALDRIAPEDKKGNLYRHSAEGLDDMPVSL